MLLKNETGSEKPKLLSKEFPVLYENRYCDQEDFSLVSYVTLSVNSNRKMTVFDIENINKNVIKLPPMFKGQYKCKIAAIGSNVYFARNNQNYITNPCVEVL